MRLSRFRASNRQRSLGAIALAKTALGCGETGRAPERRRSGVGQARRWGAREAGGRGGTAALGGSAGAPTASGGSAAMTVGVGGTGMPQAGIGGDGAADSGGASGSVGGAGKGGTSNGDCNTPPALSVLVDWGPEGSWTTVGGDATPVVVTTAEQLSQNVSGSTARVIHVKGSISSSFSIGSNKTLVGVCGAEIHGHLGLGHQSNVIVRNLKMVGNICSDSPNECKSGTDASSVNSRSHHLWFDHLDVSDGSERPPLLETWSARSTPTPPTSVT